MPCNLSKPYIVILSLLQQWSEYSPILCQAALMAQLLKNVRCIIQIQWLQRCVGQGACSVVCGRKAAIKGSKGAATTRIGNKLFASCRMLQACLSHISFLFFLGGNGWEWLIRDIKSRNRIFTVFTANFLFCHHYESLPAAFVRGWLPSLLAQVLGTK